jgi:hypothetical protein
MAAENMADGSDCPPGRGHDVNFLEGVPILQLDSPDIEFDNGRTAVREERRLGHPWEMTLHQLVEKVGRDYGIVFEVVSLPVPGTILSHWTKIYALPGIDENDLLDLAVIENLCEYFRLPRADFALDPDPEG